MDRETWVKYRKWNRAKKLRRNPTASEAKMWEHLKRINYSLPEGYVWRRQIEVAGFYIDFACKEARIGLELDGSSHIGKESKDNRRQRVLEGNAYQIIHIQSYQVFDYSFCEVVVNQLLEHTLKRIKAKELRLQGMSEVLHV